MLEHHTANEDNSDLRWTLDTSDDWALLDTLLKVHNAGNLPYHEILAIVNDNPSLKILNTHIKQKGIKL